MFHVTVLMMKQIGRFNQSTVNKTVSHLNKMREIREWCHYYNVAFKINTVVNTYNHTEDMNYNIKVLDPVRWKVFQCLKLEGENYGANVKRNVTDFLITNEQFESFVERHRDLECIVPENNETMKDSYLLLDEKLRFLNCSGGKKEPSESIMDVGVEKALEQSGFNQEMFEKRGGVFNWKKDEILFKH